MDVFTSSEIHQMFRREVRRFAQQELAPEAKQRAKMTQMPKDILRKIGEAGILGIGMPEEYGGQPGDNVSVGIAVEEIAKVDTALAVLIAMCWAFHVVMKLAPDALKQEWLPKVISGEKSTCLALTEPDCGADAAAIKTRAIRNGNAYELNGEKTSVSNCMLADVAMLWAKTDPSAGAKGISCFIVPLNLVGISRSAYPDMGLHSLGRGSITLEEVPLPAEYLIGGEGNGFKIVMGQFDMLRICVGLMALGNAQTALEEAIEYVKSRTAFGRPIAKFQGVSFKIAEHLTRIEAARLLCYNTLWMRDQGLPCTKETAMCKWWCPQVAVSAIHDSLLLHGHVGYSQEYDLEQRLRDSVGLELADGPEQIMKMIIVREVLGKELIL